MRGTPGALAMRNFLRSQNGAHEAPLHSVSRSPFAAPPAAPHSLPGAPPAAPRSLSALTLAATRTRSPFGAPSVCCVPYV